MLYPEAVGYDFVDYFINIKGFGIIECPLGEANRVDTNFRVLEPGKLLMIECNSIVTGEQKKRDIEVIEVDLPEYAKEGEGPLA